MLFIVSKILQPLLWPLNLTLICLVAGLVLCRRRVGRAGFFLVLGAVVLLLFVSLPVVSYPFRHAWETGYPVRPIADYPKADAIVVLGGTVQRTVLPQLGPEEISGSRLLGAVRLYKSGKASTVVVCGGVQYEASSGEMRVEADDMRDLLVELGVADSAIIRERISRNTYENAVQAAKILRELGKSRILLVTSAFHLNRAASVFRRQGFEVTPVPTSRQTFERRAQIGDFMPDAATLLESTLLIKEVIGYIVYKFVH